MTDLSHLRVGDTVVLSCRNSYEIATVERLTPTKITLRERSGQWRRDNGRRAGERGHFGEWDIDLGSDAMIRMRKHQIEWKIGRGMYSLTRTDINRMRSQADEAEAVLREMGKWDEPP